MRVPLAKLAFIHRRLWQRDISYRLAAVLGPPPLIGGAVAAGLWFGMRALSAATGVPAEPLPWAQPRPSPVLASATAPRTVLPRMGLPAARPEGGYVGFVSGWQGSIHPITISPTLDVDVAPMSLAPFVAAQPNFESATILAAGAPTGLRLYVGVGDAMLAIREAGTYGLTLRMEGPADRPADCLGRLVFGGGRLVSELSVGLAAIPRDHEPVAFNLQPGFYPITVGFGCWRGSQMAEQGRSVILLRGPGDATLRLVRDEEIVHPNSGP